MAEFVIKIGDQLGDNPTRYRDGDILCAFNNRQIRRTHAQHICHVKKAGFTVDGLRPNGSLAEKMRQRTRQFRCERISQYQFRRVEQATSKEIVRVNLAMEQKIANLIAGDYGVFGSPGREVWYAGRTCHDNDALTLVWNDIETHSEHREVDYRLFPLGTKDTYDCFAVAVDDFSDADSKAFVASLYDEASLQPVKPLLNKQERFVAWRDLPGMSAGTQAAIIDPKISVDIREAVEFITASIVQTKTAQVG